MAGLLLWAQTHAVVTKAIFEQWMTDLSNWGRWGKDDEMGAMNLITPAKRKQAAGLVKEGHRSRWLAMRRRKRPWTIRFPLAIR